MSRIYQRVFAREYNESRVRFGESESPSYSAILTPGGAICTDLFCAGALLERQGRKGELMYARLADPTGAFGLHIDRTDQAAAGILESMEIPCFATVIGEARMTGAGGMSRCTVRVREIREVDRYVRDSWVLRTAGLTFGRIEDLYAALNCERSDARIESMITHYHLDVPRLRDLALMVKEAIKGVNAAQPVNSQEKRPEETVLDIIREHGGKNGITLEEITRRAARQGLGPLEVGRAVESLLQDDECYQPARGVLKLL
ncbi:MAG: hypothetical protein MUC66_01175 [Methanolinea sp.]|nr:hypothetical protein [Methanolinea sp.]